MNVLPITVFTIAVITMIVIAVIVMRLIVDTFVVITAIPSELEHCFIKKWIVHANHYMPMAYAFSFHVI